MKVKGRKSYKAPSPHRQNRMLCAIIRRQDDIICRSTRFKSSILHSNKLDIDNNYLLTNSEYNDYSNINFPLQFAPNQVDPTTNLLDDVVITEIVLRPTKKPRSIGPHRSISTKNRYCFIERLLLSCKVTRPEISTCVSYIIGRMESSTKYHENKQFNVDMLFVKKIQLFILSSTENRNLHS